MNATISNKDHPEYGCATIPLPIPDEEYAHCMEMLEQLGIGGVTARDCHIERLDHSPAALDVLEGQEVNIDELDFLARNIDRYWGNEQDKFEGMAYKLGIKDIQSFIKQALLTLAGDQEVVDTVDGFIDWGEFGEFMMREDGIKSTEYGMIRRVSESAPEQAMQMQSPFL